jgi:threonine synthase
VRYVSTRGRAPALGFSDVLLAGLAGDGGLYVPESWPSLDSDKIAGLAGLPYADVAFEIVKPFVGGEITDPELREICHEAYAGFRHPAIAPLVQIGPGEWLLELFHGPTLAFKDIAMQLVARLMDHVLQARGSRVTIVAATSGDTGGAAVEAFKGRDNANLFVLFPEGRVTPFQQRQMTTAGAANVHAIAVNGTFDDCQAIVKALFADRDFKAQTALTGVNSINWARILAQVVYYITAAVALGAPGRSVSFTVPTGNFGDVFAGYAAKRSGLPVARLVIATNVNDILVRTLESGRHEVQAVMATTSPSMDIQVSSNFERLLFEASGRDGGAVARLLDGFSANGSFVLRRETLAVMRRDFSAGRADEHEVASAIRDTLAETGYIADPHTAVGLAVSRRFVEPAVPMVTLATAHPGKFADAVRAATGRAAGLPEGFGDIMKRRERFDRVTNDRAEVARLIREHSRATAERV